MATISWTNRAGGDWSLGSNWSSSLVPGAFDDAVIDLVASPPYVVTINSAQSALSLTLDSATATVELNNTLTIGTTLTVSAGTFNLNSTGTIAGGTIVGAGLVFDGGTLSGVEYQDTLDLSASAAEVKVRNGITLTGAGGSGAGSVQLTGDGSQMYFYYSQTLNTASISIGGATTYATLRQGGGGGTLALGTGLTITHAGSRALLYVTDANTILNAGTIDAGLSGGRFVVYGDGAFTNTGTIEVSNGDLFKIDTYGGFVNSGAITLATGATLELATVLTTADLGTVTNTDGTISVQGTLDNTGSVLTTGPTGLGRVVIGGQIVGGTIAGYDVGFLSGGMSGVTFVGPLDLSPAGSGTAISNGITLVGAGGSGPGSVLLTGDDSNLFFSGAQTVDDATIDIGGAGDYALLWALGGGALTLGANLFVTQAGSLAGFYIPAGNSIVNTGTIGAAISSGHFHIYGAGGFTNDAAIGISNGDLFRVDTAVLGSGTFALNGDAYLTMSLAVDDAQTIDFTGSAGHLELTQSSTFEAGVIGFATGDTIDFQGIGLAVSYSFSGGILTLYDGSGTPLADVTLSTPITNPLFSLEDDGLSGTLLGIGSASEFSGTITTGIVLDNPARENPSTLVAGGYVTNNTAAYDGDAVYGTSAAAWTFTNYGAINATAAYSHGVRLMAGGFVTNDATATIFGTLVGVQIENAAGTVANLGDIGGGFSSASTGIWLVAGGTVTNGNAGVTTAVISAEADGIVIGTPTTPGAGTVVNYGTIYGPTLGVWLAAGGSLLNFGSILSPGAYGDGVSVEQEEGTVANIGLIEATNLGVWLRAGGTVANSGTITGETSGVYIAGAAGTVISDGTIGAAGGSGVGVELAAGGLVRNNFGGTIDGDDAGVGLSGAAGTVLNYGAITATDAATGFGVYLGQGSAVTNGSAAIADALIEGQHGAITVYGGPADIVNYGTLIASVSYSPAIDLRAGGSVTNQATGLIEGGGFGILVAGGAGTVVNLGTTIGTNDAGVRLDAGGAVDNGTSGPDSAAILSSEVGVELNGGGTVTNGHAGSSAALIEGGFYGVRAAYAAATVANFGTIEGTNAAGIFLGAGGDVDNAAGALITSLATGIAIYDAAGAVDNAGAVQAGGVAVYLANGSVTNQQGGTIEGGHGVEIGGPGTVVNLGAIAGTIAYAGFGVILGEGGSVTNGSAAVTDASINGTLRGVSVYDDEGTVTNFGTIAVSITYASAVYLHAGGSVVNQASGLIGGGGQGIVIDGGAGTITNLGTIAGTYSAGIVLVGGGDVTNGTAAIDDASITGLAIGVLLSTVAGDVVNYGTIGGATYAGILAGAGANITNDGVIVGAIYGARLGGAPATVSNDGTIAATYAGSTAVRLAAGGTIQNTGTISADRNGVVLDDVGLVVNRDLIEADIGVNTPAAATVINYGTIAAAAAAYATGVYMADAGGSVSNFGTIGASGAASVGVNLHGGGSITNVASESVGSISGDHYGVYVGGAGGTVRNFGSIVGYDAGVVMRGAADTVLNYGVITALGTAGIGVALYGSTLFNAGVIIGGADGGYAVRFGTGDDRLIINPGGFFEGVVAGSTGTDTIELGTGSDTLDGFGTDFIGFEEIQVDAGATWDLTATSPLTAGITIVNAGSLTFADPLTNNGRIEIEADAILAFDGVVAGGGSIDFTGADGTLVIGGATMANTISGFDPGDVINLTAFADGSSATLGANNLLTVSGGGFTYTLQFNPLQDFSGQVFSVADNGFGGTRLFVTDATIPPPPSGLTLSPSSDSGPPGDNLTNDTTPLITGFGVAGNIVTLFADGAVVGSGTVGGEGTWAITAATLANGAHSLTATQADPLGSASAPSTPLIVTIDTTLPTTALRVLAVDQDSGATPIGIIAPSDAVTPTDLLAIAVTGLPTDGMVVLADGITAVTVGQALTVAQLTGLQFIPTAGINGQTSRFSYSVTDLAGNTTLGSAALGINLPSSGPSLINGLGGAEGFGENALPPNDDGSSSAIDITAVFDSGLNFFGVTYDSLYVNNNGNITFSGPLSTFTPGPITAGINNPIIAAFWADVDTTGGPGVPTGGNATGSNTVYYDLDPVNDVFTVTWNDVGYYNSHNDKLDAFQLQLIDRGNGNFDIVFRYQAVYWTTGDASGGENGLGGTPARAGYSAGDGLHAYELPQSGGQDSMLGLPFTPAPSGTQGVTGETGVYLFEVRNGVVIPPPPTNLALSPASDSGTPGDNVTSVTTPIITGLGVSGYTVTLFDGGAAVGSTTVASDGTWAVTTSALTNGVHNLTATQTDTAGTTSAQSVPLPLTVVAGEPHLFSFLFTFGDGSDYYFGTVVDDGRYGYSTGQIINTLSTFGRYDILGDLGTTTAPVGTVVVATYSHGGPGQASTTPVNTAAGIPSGTNGLGSESDAVLGLDGITHPFNNSMEASFLTNSAFGFVYTYADGAAFYTGTVSDDGRFGITTGSRTVFDASGNFRGTYVIFSAGMTVRDPGTVVVDRFTAGGVSFTPNRSGGPIDGAGGLGSELGSIIVNGETLLFGNFVEPFVALSFPTVPVAAAPNAADVFTAEVNQLYADVLGRLPDASGLTVYTAALAGGMTPTALRQELAASVEAQSALGRLYRQVLGRDIDAGGLATYSAFIANGSSLAAVQLIIGQSQEVQDSINQIYRDVLGRDADGGGLTSYMGVLANQTDPFSLRDVRETVAHSFEAATDLGQLVKDTLGRDPFSAELVGMQDALTDGGSQQTLQSQLLGTGTAGSYAVLTDAPGNTRLEAAPQTPTLFVFEDAATISLDTVAGFVPGRDTIQLPQSLVGDLTELQADIVDNPGGSMISFNSTQGIVVTGVSPDSFNPGSFRIV